MGGKFSKKSKNTHHSRSNGIKDEKNKTLKDHHGTSRFNSKHQRKKRHLKQVKRDQKSQRVSKDQLYRLSFEMTRTPWYLGRRLGFDEKEVQKVILKGQSSQGIKFHFLMNWRMRNGWKATAQNLVIQLELAGYDYEEYKSILDEKCNGVIYAKPPEIESVKTKKAKGHFRYDDYPSKSNNRRKLKEENQAIALLEKNTADILSFARRSWKKPHNQDSDGGTEVLEKNKNPTSRSRIPEAHSTLDASNCDHSSFKYKIKSFHNESETKRNDTSEKRRHNGVSGRQRLHARNTNNAKNNATPTSSTTRHRRNESTDSQLESYREEIVRVSERQYDVTKNGDFSRSCITKTGNGEHALPVKVVKFETKRIGSGPVKGQISGLDLTRDDDIVISDSNNKRIQILDKHGHFLSAFSTNSKLNPKGVFVTKRNEILVCCGKEVRMFDMDGHVKLVFGQGNFRNNSYSVVCDKIGVSYVTDIIDHTVSVFDHKGNIRKRFGCHGSNLASFDQPVALAISKRDELLISDSQNHVIKVYSLAGRPLFEIGGKGSEDGKFWNPFGLCFGNNGYLFVADCGNNRISAFDQNYKFLRHILDEADGLKMPSFIKVSSAGLLVICEWKSEEVKVFSLETAV